LAKVHNHGYFSHTPESMQKDITIKLKPSEASDNDVIRKYLALSAGRDESSITGFYKFKQSIDARSRQQVWINLTLKVYIDEPFHQRDIAQAHFKESTNSTKRVVIVGAGPAGLFAALKLLEQGIKPIILERGKEVRARRRDLAILNREGIINPESNYCFGEGGAGTYSDGKLYTRSGKRGDVTRILNLFYQFGADERILYEAHPHIGTNKLPLIITAIRQQIIDCGGLFLFEKKVIDLIVDTSEVKGVVTMDGETILADAVILATGHSARDIYQLLHQKNILIEAKPFALGVRLEHPQVLIDSIQYHGNPLSATGQSLKRDEYLPPASYSLVEQVNGKGVFSFCMCPGGIIAPAATNASELVVNGWSPSKRDNPYANSGMVVQVERKDAEEYFAGIKKTNKNISSSPADFNLPPESEVTKHLSGSSPLFLMYFQQHIERLAFAAGGGKFAAPAQRMVDFSTNKISSSLPGCSYLPGIVSSDLTSVLPSFIHKRLQEGFKVFGKKMHGFYTNDAVAVATESRTSSPVRIPRDEVSLEHPHIKNLYPCGEGAGYAGGIVSAAMDGEKVAVMIAKKLSL
jgi:uncharacterized FAD-dependent dehydrogenase